MLKWRRWILQHLLVPHYVLKWRRWILQHLLGALPASPILDLVPVDLIVQMTIDDEMAYIHSRMARTRDLQTRQYKSMLRSGYSKLTALSFSITAHPTVIFDKLTGAEEAYKLRTENVPSVCLLQDGSVGSTDVFLSDTDRHHHLIIDTGATGHLVCDRTCLVQPAQHKPLQIRIRTGNAVSFSESIGPATFIVRDIRGYEYPLTRTVIFAPEFKANLFSPPRDWNDNRTKVVFNDELNIQLADGTTIPF